LLLPTAKINNLKGWEVEEEEETSSTRVFCDSQFSWRTKFHNSKVDCGKAAGESENSQLVYIENYYEFFPLFFNTLPPHPPPSQLSRWMLLRNNDEYIFSLELSRYLISLLLPRVDFHGNNLLPLLLVLLHGSWKFLRLQLL
jgi:hypothetical protein